MRAGCSRALPSRSSGRSASQPSRCSSSREPSSSSVPRTTPGSSVLGLSERWQQEGLGVVRGELVAGAKPPGAPRSPRPPPRGARTSREHDTLHLDARARCLRRLPPPARRRPLHAGGGRLARRRVGRLEVAAEARVDARDRSDHREPWWASAYLAQARSARSPAGFASRVVRPFGASSVTRASAAMNAARRAGQVAVHAVERLQRRGHRVVVRIVEGDPEVDPARSPGTPSRRAARYAREDGAGEPPQTIPRIRPPSLGGERPSSR